jgi:hypothetical protein
MAGTKERKMAKGDVLARDNGTVMVLAWQDNRTVRVLSTLHDATTEPILVRKKGGRGEMEEVQKPKAVIDYNKFMSGVDRIDQMISYYPTVRKTLKWFKKLFWWLVELCIHNGQVILNHNLVAAGMRKKTLLDFQTELCDTLCSGGNPPADDSEDDEEEDGPEDGEEEERRPVLVRAPRDSSARLVGGYKEVQNRTVQYSKVWHNMMF